MQLARRSQNTLTCWTHFQKEPHQPCSLPEEARTHSHTGHIFRRSLISHAACLKKPEHTHILDTLSEGASSAMQLARRSQNTLTCWTHFEKEHHQPSSLPEEARTHSHTGHIFRRSPSLPEEARTHSHTRHSFGRSPISHAAGQKKPEHTHCLDTFSEGASSVMQLARTHSQAGHIFRRSLISHAACLKKPEHTHILDTFSEGA